jgi:AraC family transcriptional regulator, regulatory protein of adaptative response / DNA-3-methyladenine glycosylase II
MPLDAAHCYRALATRDARFDGRFFTGVTSTGIFCRPVCPARTPGRKNCVFFEHAAQAQAAGFRPCLRCRPESAPGTPAWRGTSTTVSRALALIDDGILDQESVPELANHLGVGERHLRRLFRERLGVSPLQVAQTRRVHLGRRLLQETQLSVSQIAASVGFASERRFRAAVQRAFRRSPTELRRGAEARRSQADGLRLHLSYRPPFNWSHTLAYLGRREIPEIERVDTGSYTRLLDFDGDAGSCVVENDEKARCLLLSLPPQCAPVVADTVDRLRRHFDLNADPAAIAEVLARDRGMRRRLARQALPRILGGFDPFEMVVRAIIGQQVSVDAATTVTRRVVRRCGRRVRDGRELCFLFPTAKQLLDCDLGGVGLTTRRRATLLTAAEAVHRQPQLLRLGPDLESRLKEWCALPGIGDWTAQILAMRALREPDAFPAGDLGVRKALSHGDELISHRDVRDVAEAWRPFRSYATVLLWEDAAVHRPHRRKK